MWYAKCEPKTMSMNPNSCKVKTVATEIGYISGKNSVVAMKCGAKRMEHPARVAAK